MSAKVYVRAKASSGDVIMNGGHVNLRRKNFKGQTFKVVYENSRHSSNQIKLEDIDSLISKSFV